MKATVLPIAVLPLPTEDDSLSVLVLQLSLYLEVLHIHASVADTTGHKSNNKTVETRAMYGMRPHKQEYFMAWKERNPSSLPCVDYLRTLTEDTHWYLNDR